MEVTGDNFINTIVTKYLRHLGSIERLKESFNPFEDKEEISNNKIGELVDYVLEIKYEKLTATKEGNIEKLKEIDLVYEKLRDNSMFQMVDKKANLEESDDGYLINIESGLLRKAHSDYMDNAMDLVYDNSQFKNSLIVSLVIGLEILIAEIVKNYVKTMDYTDQVLKGKKIDFKTLAEIGSVDEAKAYLIDQHIETLLRASFTDWLDEIEGTLKIKVKRHPIIKEDIKLINETIQRRHLIIHNDGVINDLYINKIDVSLRDSINKGDSLESDDEYLTERISIFRKFGLILIFSYGIKKYRNKMQEFFSEFHNILLTFMKDEFEAPRYIFNYWANNEKISKESQGISIVNYFLTYILNEDESIIKEIIDFNAEDYGEQFVLAKKVLLERGNAEKEVIKFLDSMDDDGFANALTWPLFDLWEKSQEYKDFVKDKIESIMKKEMEGDLVEIR